MFQVFIIIFVLASYKVSTYNSWFYQIENYNEKRKNTEKLANSLNDEREKFKSKKTLSLKDSKE